MLLYFTVRLKRYVGLGRGFFGFQLKLAYTRQLVLHHRGNCLRRCDSLNGRSFVKRDRILYPCGRVLRGICLGSGS